MVYARLTISINQTHCRAQYLMNHWKAAGLKTNNEDEEIDQKRRQWLVFYPSSQPPLLLMIKKTIPIFHGNPVLVALPSVSISFE